MLAVSLCSLALQQVLRDATTTQALVAVSQKVASMNPRPVEIRMEMEGKDFLFLSGCNVVKVEECSCKCRAALKMNGSLSNVIYNYSGE